MTEPVVSPGPPPALPVDAYPPPERPERSDLSQQLRAGGILVAALAVIGIVVGLIWQAWSPDGPAGLIINGGVQADENEVFVAGDGRFALMAVIIGLAAGIAAWFFRRVRGPVLAVMLVVAGLVGSAVAAWVGYLVRGTGHHFACGDGTSTCINHLPLTVHMHALLLVEALVAVLVYSLFVAFAVADDLGRPDPAYAAAHPPVYELPPTAYAEQPTFAQSPSAYGTDPSVGAEGGLQDPWRHGDTAGPA